MAARSLLESAWVRVFERLNTVPFPRPQSTAHNASLHTLHSRQPLCDPPLLFDRHSRVWQFYSYDESPRHDGLPGMRASAERIGGKLDVRSTAGLVVNNH